MAVLPILLLGDPRLRRCAAEVADVDAIVLDGRLGARLRGR